MGDDPVAEANGAAQPCSNSYLAEPAALAVNKFRAEFDPDGKATIVRAAEVRRWKLGDDR
jgi:hypothetical protein